MQSNGNRKISWKTINAETTFVAPGPKECRRKDHPLYSAEILGKQRLQGLEICCLQYPTKYLIKYMSVVPRFYQRMTHISG